MLQLIGFVLCAAMFAHGVSMFGNANFRAPDENGNMKITEAGNMAAGLFIVAAGAFALWFYILGQQIERSSGFSSAPSYFSTSDPAAEAAAEKAADEAMAAAAAAEKAASEAMQAPGQ